MKTEKYSWIAAILSALSATALHGYLTTKFYALRFGAADENSFCNLSTLWNCDAVSASQYAQLFGIPMALWGLVANLFFALILIFVGLRWYGDEIRGQRYAFWYALMIAAASVVMAIISVTQIHSLCLFCVAAYALSAIAIIATYFWAKPKFLSNLVEDLKALFKAHHVTLGSFVLIPAAAYFIDSMYVDKYQMGQIEMIATEKVAQWQNNPSQTFTADQGLVLFKGQNPPRVEIVEFADFRCPHCKSAYFSLDAFVESHPDVKLIYKYYPLDGTCNPAMGDGGGDGISCEAAFVSHCSEKLAKKGWAAHHLLFDQQDKLRTLSDRQDVRNIICDAFKDINCEALKACTESAETKTEIQAMAAEGARAGIKGTPSVFVNGRSLVGGQLLPVLEKAYKSSKPH